MLNIMLTPERHIFIVLNAYCNIYQVRLIMVSGILLIQLMFLLATAMQTGQGVRMIGRARLEGVSS